MSEKEKVVHVFWTGGLDSTFRVLQLVISKGVVVQPHYIIRHEESTGNEIDAMNNIGRKISARYPKFRPNLLPIIYTNEDTIPESQEVKEAIEELIRNKMTGMHEQYEILARYCKASNLEEIDLTYEVYTHRELPKTSIAYHFGKSYPFDNFRNPAIKMIKGDYYGIAEADGWDDLLNLTSFCRRPRRKGKPCGTCGPCCDAVTEGMGFRLPFIPRMRARILIPFRRYYRNHAYKENPSWIIKMIKRAFEDKF